MALVVSLFALRKGDSGFHQVALPVQAGTDAGFSLGLGGDEDFGQLFFVQQQFAGACGIGHEMRGRGLQRGNLRAQQPRLAVFYQHVGIR